MEIYKEMIAAAQDFETLCNIVEQAADDMNITNADYCRVYDMATARDTVLASMGK